jgi:dimethylaniline monooxygenase (N-oxide forming)
MNSKKVAIIGAGRSGLVTAKYIKQHGMNPCVFDKASEIGGLWSKNTAIWEGLYSNISKYTTAFVDHPWPEGTCIFPSKVEVQDYLNTYAERFRLNDHICLRHQVLSAKQTSDKKWELRILNLNSNDTKVLIFDFLVISSGLQDKPYIPELRNSDKFEGIVMHSSEFKLKDPRLKDKKVIVVGSSHSGVDLSVELVNHAKSVLNVFSRPYLVTSRLVKTKMREHTYKIVPLDFYGNTRSILYGQRNSILSDQEKLAQRRAYLRKRFPIQTNRALIHPDLFVDVDEENVDFVTSISDCYIDLVLENKITPKRSYIREVTCNGVIFEDGLFEEIDAIIFCTGYNFNLIYLEKSIIDEIVTTNEKYFKFQLLLSMYTFNPSVENFAVNSMVDLVQFRGSELQAKLIAMVFSDKLKLDESRMRDDIEKMRQKITSNSIRLKSPYGNPVEISENLAQMMNLKPDLESIKQSDPNMFRLFWENLLMTVHYFFDENKQIALELMNQVDEIYNREYVIDKEESEIRFSDILEKFNEVYKLQNNY